MTHASPAPAASTSSARPRLLIAMIEAGGGHKAPAMAIAEAIERRTGGAIDVDVLDFMAAVGDARFDARHKASWRWMLEHPGTTRRLQRWIDEVVPIPLTRAAQGFTLRGHAERAAAFVRGAGYDAVLCTHFLPLHALAIARDQGRIDVPLWAFGSDPFDGHALWAEPRVDTMFVASDAARGAFVRKGVPADRIDVVGYPLRRVFRAPPPSRPDARARLGLDPERFTVVQTAGGEGIDRSLVDHVDALLGSDLDLQHVVVCGRNDALRRELAQRAASAPPGRLVPLGFVTEMPTLLAAADVVLAKAGAASTLEPLAVGAPVFHTSFVAGNEKANVDFCLDAGIGAWVPTGDDAVARLRALANEPAALDALRSRVAGLDLPDGAEAIAHRVDAELRGTSDGAASREDPRRPRSPDAPHP